MAVRLHLTHIPEADCLIALEFGRVDEGQFDDCWRSIGDGRDDVLVAYLHDGPRGHEIGFKVRGFSIANLNSLGFDAIWMPPRFDAPTLGLRAASVGEIVVAARALFGGRASVNQEFFTRAVEASGDEAVEAWQCCLEAGDAMAHYGLGGVLLELGRYREAYRHLRYYTELAPAGSWAWCSYGRAAEALGQFGEARAAYRRAVDLEERGAPHTAACELLAALQHRRHGRRRHRRQG